MKAKRIRLRLSNDLGYFGLLPRCMFQHKGFPVILNLTSRLHLVIK